LANTKILLAGGPHFWAKITAMPTQASNELLRDLEERVEQDLETAIRVFQNLTPAVLNAPSASGGWSIAQCLWHLNSYGDYYLPRVEAEIQNGGQPSPVFSSGWLGAYFTKMMKPGENMKKMKAFKSHTPPTQLDAQQVVAEFIRQQEWLLKLLREARGVNLNRIRIPISISRWVRIKLGDVLQFFIMHSHRHVVQALRNVPM